MSITRKTLSITLLLAACITPTAFARKKISVYPVDQPVATSVAAQGEIEVAFSPDEGAEALAIKTIDSAQQSINMLAYSFTSAPIVEALVRAKKRGVNISLVVDYKNNISQDSSGKSKAALNTLVNAGANVRIIAVYAIHHDKVIIVDEKTVETGSFNYSSAAAHRNSENVIVLWNNPQLAKVYLKHWQRNWDQGEAFSSAY